MFIVHKLPIYLEVRSYRSAALLSNYFSLYRLLQSRLAKREIARSPSFGNIRRNHCALEFRFGTESNKPLLRRFNFLLLLDPLSFLEKVVLPPSLSRTTFEKIGFKFAWKLLESL